MRLNKDVQYAFLACFYLARAGRASVNTMSLNLNVPKAFLNQVTRKLKIDGILKSIKGPGGGYELNSATKVIDVINCFTPVSFLGSTDYITYRQGPPEGRALANLALNLDGKLSIILDSFIVDAMQSIVDKEVKYLDELNTKGLEN